MDVSKNLFEKRKAVKMKEKLTAILLCIGMLAGMVTPLAAEKSEDFVVTQSETYADEEIEFLVPVEQQTEVPEGYIGIYTAEDLDNVRNDLDANYILMNDIDLSEYENWVPIGDTVAIGFRGVFDGNGHSIENLKIDNTNLNKRRLGLFSKIYYSSISNLIVTNANISTNNSSADVGIISAAMENSIVDNCSVSGILYAENTQSSVGGIIGNQQNIYSGNKESIIKNCISFCDISGGYVIGGIVGYIIPYTSYYPGYSYTTSVNIENCHSKGYLCGVGHVGGIVGDIGLTNSVPGVSININRCESTATILGVDLTTIGGIVGVIWSGSDYSEEETKRFINITKSYSNCLLELKSEEHEMYVGGIIGQVNSSSNGINNAIGTRIEISDAYSIMSVYCESASQNTYVAGYLIGGIIGEHSFPDSSYTADITFNTINNVYSILAIVTNSDFNEYNRIGHAVGSVSNFMSQNEVEYVISGCYKPISQYEFIGGNSTGTGLPSSVVLTNCTTLSDTEMQSASSFVGFDFDNVWEIGVTDGYPYPTLRNNPHNDVYTKYEYNGNFYSVIDKTFTWEQAKAYCESLGGHLATITSQGEQDFIVDIIKKQSDYKNVYYLGATTDGIENAWHWVTNEPFDYTNWQEGQPDGHQDDEDYLQMNTRKYFDNDIEFKWHDIANNNNWVEFNLSRGFICEWENEESDISSISTTFDTSTVTLQEGDTFNFDGIVSTTAAEGLVAVQIDIHKAGDDTVGITYTRKTNTDETSPLYGNSFNLSSIPSSRLETHLRERNRALRCPLTQVGTFIYTQKTQTETHSVALL